MKPRSKPQQEDTGHTEKITLFDMEIIHSKKAIRIYELQVGDEFLLNGNKDKRRVVRITDKLYYRTFNELGWPYGNENTFQLGSKMFVEYIGHYAKPIIQRKKKKDVPKYGRIFDIGHIKPHPRLDQRDSLQ